MDRHSAVDSPSELASGSGKTRTRFVQKEGFYAVHHWTEDDEPEHPILVLDDAAVFRGNSSGNEVRKEGPVYESQPGGTPAIPTGRVFVRFAETVKASAREKDIRSAGYRVVQALPWAPQAVWVEADTGGVVESLRNIDRLERIKDVVHVEPQMLMPAATRV
jgi:hypothetical protein